MENSIFVISREELSEVFFNQNLTYKEIAIKYGIDVNCVRRWVNKYGFRKSPEQKKEIARRKTCEHLAQLYKNDPVREVLGSKEKLEELYLNQNLGMKDIAAQLGVSGDTVRYALEKLGLHKEWEQRMKVRAKHLLEEKGVDNVAKLKETKEKRRNTCLAKYGTPAAMQNSEVKEKRNKTNLEKYGTTSPMLKPEIIEKRRKTCLERYGVDNIAKLRDFRLKEMEKHYPQELVEILIDREKFRDAISKMPIKTATAISQKWGCSLRTVLLWCDRHNSRDLLNSSVSSQEKEIGIFLDALGVRHFRDRQMLSGQRGEIGGVRELDLFCPDYNVAIEYNGAFWHSLQKKGKDYHIDKADKAEGRGIKLFQVFSWEYEKDSDKVFRQIQTLFAPKEILPNEKFRLKGGEGRHFILCENEIVYEIVSFPHQTEKDNILEIYDFLIYSPKEPKNKMAFFVQLAKKFKCNKIIFFADRAKVFDDFFESTSFLYRGKGRGRAYCFYRGRCCDVRYIRPEADESDRELLAKGMIIEGCGDKIWSYNL